MTSQEQQPDTTKLPTELTAKNGAKALLIGEFFEEIHLDCCDCNGEGVTQIGSPEQCETCGGTGVITQRVDVEWTTIKAIYKKIVEHYTT
jgi:DnaJ-class molecular chaperone